MRILISRKRSLKRESKILHLHKSLIKCFTNTYPVQGGPVLVDEHSPVPRVPNTLLHVHSVASAYTLKWLKQLFKISSTCGRSFSFCEQLSGDVSQIALGPKLAEKSLILLISLFSSTFQKKIPPKNL